jgi:hypothetical protein
MMRRPAVLAALGILAGAGSVAACGGGDFDPAVPLFASEVTGAVTRSIVGVSAYGVVRDGGLTGFTFVMEDSSGSNSILLQKPSTTKPVPGDYLIVPPDDVGPLGLYRGRVRMVIDGVLEEYTAQSGALTIVEAAPTWLRGTFEFDAVRTSPCCDPAPVTIHVEGTYTAVQGPVAAAR